MPIKTIIAKNVTGSPVSIPELGVSIAGGASYTLSDFFRLEEIQESATLTSLINSNSVVVNDGINDLTSGQSLNFVTPVLLPEGTSPSWKQPARLATTANITLSGAQTIDGVAAVAGDRVLVKNQSTASQNGLYTVATGAWVRAPDMDQSSESGSGLMVVINAGSTNSGRVFQLSTPDPITLGSTALTFTQFPGSGGSGDVVGPASSTDNALALFNGTTGKLLKQAAANTPTVDASGNLVMAASATVDGVDVSAHASRHLPGGADALTTAAAGTIAIGDTAATGAAASFARSDHVHALPSPAAPADVTKSAASAGAATTVARADHKHDVSTAAPATGIGAGNSEGTATSVARSDHNHTIRETGGPTDLTVGAIPDGAHVVRSGTALVGGPVLGPTDFWVEDWVGNVNVARGVFLGSVVGNGTNTTAIPAASVTGVMPSGVFIRSGTNANSGYAYATSSLIGDTFGVVSRKYVCQFQWLTAFTSRTVRCGFLDTLTATDAVDGAYFEVLANVCSAKTSSNSSRTTNATTVTLSLNTVYTLDLEVNAAATSARFRVYAGNNSTPILDVTNSTNIPTTSARAFGSGIVATMTTATASDIGILYKQGIGTVAGFTRVRG